MKSAQYGNFLNTLRRETQQGLCVGNAAGNQIVSRGDAEAFSVFPDQVVFADEKNLRQIIQRYFFGIMCKKIFPYLHQLVLGGGVAGEPVFAFRKAGGTKLCQIFVRQKLLVWTLLFLQGQQTGETFVKNCRIAWRKYAQGALQKELRIEFQCVPAVKMYPF